jgi:hypothetical protein
MDSYFKELFIFTSGERKGLIFLSVIVILLLLSLLLLPLILDEKDKPGSEWIREMAQLDIRDSLSNDQDLDSAAEEPTLPDKPAFFAFDPNTAKDESLHALGLTSWQIEIINRYRNKGGRFRNAGDFGRIYGIGLAQFEELKPFIHISYMDSISRKDSLQFPNHKTVFTKHLPAFSNRTKYLRFGRTGQITRYWSLHGSKDYPVS